MMETAPCVPRHSSAVPAAEAVWGAVAQAADALAAAAPSLQRLGDRGALCAATSATASRGVCLLLLLSAAAAAVTFPATSPDHAELPPTF